MYQCKHCGRKLKEGELYENGKVIMLPGEPPLCLCEWSMLSFVAELEAVMPDWKQKLEKAKVIIAAEKAQMEE